MINPECMLRRTKGMTQSPCYVVRRLVCWHPLHTCFVALERNLRQAISCCLLKALRWRYAMSHNVTQVYFDFLRIKNINNMNKIKQWVIAIRNEEADRMSYGTVRTLKLIEDESERLMQQVKNLNIPAVINRRELLIDFLKYINSNDADILKDVIDDDSVDEYLKSINSL
jgi:hypothetical protein